MASNWKTLTLGEVSTWSSGGTPKKSEPSFWGGDIPWISASSMEGHLYSDSKLKITEAGLSNGSRLAPKDSILLLVRGSILHQKMQVGIATKPLTFNQDVKCLVANEDYIDPWYLLLWFKAKEKELLTIVESTGIGAGKFDTKLLSEYPIEIPPEEEKVKIREFGKALFDKTTNLIETNQTLEQMAQALFKSWFVDFDPVIDNALEDGNDIPEELQDRAERRKEQIAKPDHQPLPDDIRKLFPSEFEITEEMGWVPKGWIVSALAKHIDILNGFAFKSSDYSEEGIFVLRTKNFSNGVVQRRTDDVFLPKNFLDTHGKYLCQPFDYHLVMVGASVGNTGLIFPNHLPALRNQNMWCFRTKNQDKVSQPFVKYLLDSIVTQSIGLASGSAREFFRKGDFGNQFVCLGTDSIQNLFSRQCSPYIEKQWSLDEQTTYLTNLRDTLLPKLISGELTI